MFTYLTGSSPPFVGASSLSSVNRHGCARTNNSHRLEIVEKAVSIATMRHEAKFDQPEPILVLAGELEQILLVTVFDVGLKNVRCQVPDADMERHERSYGTKV